jgi:hypothetical protein
MHGLVAIISGGYIFDIVDITIQKGLYEDSFS